MNNRRKQTLHLAPRSAQLEGNAPPLPFAHHSPLTTRAAGAPAFTLLEVILAVSIAGALLAGAASLMVSVSKAWMERQDRHFFEDHVDGVSEFLQACFTAAGTEIALEGAPSTTSNNSEDSEKEDEQTEAESNPPVPDNAADSPEASEANADRNAREIKQDSSGGLVRVSEEPIGWASPPGYASYQDPLLHFALKDTPPLLIQSENAPVVGVEAFLHFEEDEGLSLLWYTPLQERTEDLSDLRRTLVSELVTQVEYIYWDERFEDWETETQPQEGEGKEQFLLPRFLKLTFEYEGETKERKLTLPVPSQSVLLF